MAKRWAPYKDEIRSLYIGDGRSLDDVRRIIKGRHNFEASVRSYRKKLDEWGMKKNKVAANLGNRVEKAQISRTTKKTGPDITDGASNTVLQQSTDMASPPGLPPMSALQFSNAWTAPLNFSDNLSQEIPGSSLPTIETLHDHSAPVRVNNMQILDITSQQGLFNAIWNGEEDHVATLLSSGISVRTVDGDGNPPLHAAILKGNLTIVKSLLKYGADANAIGFKRRSPLHLAIRSEALAGILLRYSPLISPQDEDGNTPLHYLLNQEKWWSPEDTAATIKAILSSSADINIINRLGESPLHRMISDARPDNYRYMEIVLEVLDHNPDVKSPMRKQLNATSVFLEKSKLLATQKMLNRWEAQLYWRELGYRCLEKLLVAGADPNLIVGSEPLLIQYLLCGIYFERTTSEKVLLLLIEKANLDIMGPGGNRPLHLILGGVETRARDYRHWDLGFHATTVALLDRNVDVNQRE